MGARSTWAIVLQVPSFEVTQGCSAGSKAGWGIRGGPLQKAGAVEEWVELGCSPVPQSLRGSLHGVIRSASRGLALDSRSEPSSRQEVELPVFWSPGPGNRAVPPLSLRVAE